MRSSNRWKKKTYGNDGLKNEMFKYGMGKLTHILTLLINSIIECVYIPKQWLNFDITLLYKKGNIGDINNYRPISSMSLVYLILSKCICRRLKCNLNNNKPEEIQ